MPRPLLPEDMQELAAGYVLGDLNSAEAEQFRALLAEMPDLQAEVASLQEALAMMPYGLDEVNPEVGLRSQILSAAQAELSQPQPVLQPVKRGQRRLPWAMSTIAAGLTIVCGLATLRLSNQVRLLQAQYPQSDLAVESDITLTWSGLRQILQDHQQAMVRPEGPVDFVVDQPDEIPDMLQGFQTTVAALPLLPAKQGRLLGGSNCHLGETKGLRLTYQLKTDQRVSAYQLDLGDGEFPEFPSAQMTLQQPDGTGVVLWRDDDYLYALVAELPAVELQNLAYAIEGI